MPEVSEYLLLWMHEELERLWHRLGAMHTSHDAAATDDHNATA
jgi:hypothetical protein